MRRNTVITLIASVGFGALAVFLARGWINDAVTAQQKQNISAAAATNFKPVKTKPVLVLDVDVAFGDKLTSDMLRLVDYPEDFVPNGTFSELSSLFEKDGPTITVLERMKINEPVLDFKITGRKSGASMASLISEGHRAVSVKVDAISGVGGFVMPEDRVDVIFIHDSDPNSRGINLVSDILMQNVRVLGIDQNMRNGDTAPSVVRTVTLEVKQDEAQKIQLAMDAGKISLTLRPSGDVSVKTPISVAKTGLIEHRTKTQSQTQATKVVKNSKTPTSKQPSQQSQVTIIRGEERDEVTVRREDMATIKTAAGG